MKIEFQVGDKEKHKVKFSHNEFWGKFECSVDGNPIPVEGLPHLMLHLDAVRTFWVGDVEKHEVRVQITRPLILAGARKDWKYKIFVDNKEYKTVVTAQPEVETKSGK
jgi:hypothetical protein